MPPAPPGSRLCACRRTRACIGAPGWPCTKGADACGQRRNAAACGPGRPAPARSGVAMPTSILELKSAANGRRRAGSGMGNLRPWLQVLTWRAAAHSASACLQLLPWGMSGRLSKVSRQLPQLVACRMLCSSCVTCSSASRRPSTCAASECMSPAQPPAQPRCSESS